MKMNYFCINTVILQTDNILKLYNKIGLGDNIYVVFNINEELAYSIDRNAIIFRVVNSILGNNEIPFKFEREYREGCLSTKSDIASEGLSSRFNFDEIIKMSKLFNDYVLSYNKGIGFSEVVKNVKEVQFLITDKKVIRNADTVNYLLNIEKPFNIVRV